MRSRDPMGDAQAKAGTWYLTFHGSAPVKPLKNAALFLKRYRSTMVSNLQRNTVIGPQYLDAHWRVLGRVLERIIDKLLDGELHQTPIDHDRRQWTLAGDTNLAIVDSNAHGSDYFADNLTKV